MKRMIWALAVAAACSVTAEGQTPAADAAAPDTKMMKGGPVTVTGCVVEATAGQYTLTNAVMTNKGREMSADKMPADKMPGDMKHHEKTYKLAGDSDLKPHVGHKVQVTGTVGKMDKDRPAAAADKAMMNPGALTVTSLTMISATCP